MTITGAQKAALDYIESLSGRPQTIFPNITAKGKVPRWEVFEGPVDPSVDTLGGQGHANLMLQIDVVTKGGEGSADQRDQVQMVLDAFPVLRNFGNCQVIHHPSVGGYRKDKSGAYRASVTVPYRLLRL